MNVYFDFEADEQYSNLIPTPEAKAYSDELRTFISEKLIPIQEDIDQAENEFLASHNGEMAYIRIIIMTDPQGIRCFGYSEDMEVKIMDSLQTGWAELSSRFLRAKSVLYN